MNVNDNKWYSKPTVDPTFYFKKDIVVLSIFWEIKEGNEWVDELYCFCLRGSTNGPPKVLRCRCGDQLLNRVISTLWPAIDSISKTWVPARKSKTNLVILHLSSVLLVIIMIVIGICTIINYHNLFWFNQTLLQSYQAMIYISIIIDSQLIPKWEYISTLW